MADDEVEVEAPVGDELYDNLTAVCKEALLHDGLKRGLHEVAHVLDNHTGKLCLLAEDCDNDNYVNLVTALCQESGCPLQVIESRETLGNIVGLGTACSETKPVKCTCAVITVFGREIEALTKLKSQIVLDN